MELVFDVAAWFADPANWSGRDAIPQRLFEHVALSAAAVITGLAIAVPLALYIGHTGRGAFLVINLTNLGRALPSYAVLVILFGFFLGASTDLGVVTNAPTFLAMVALAVPPIVTNTHAGLRDVDRDLVEAARGMGMRGSEVLRRVEVPIAVPVIIVGLRIATVQVIATAALGAVIGGGGLGRYIVQGLARFDDARLAAGALLVILLALLAELFFIWLQRRVVSSGIRQTERPAYSQAGQARAAPGA
ncbi:ABC transporter permease subunit [soil metagenome]